MTHRLPRVLCIDDVEEDVRGLSLALRTSKLAEIRVRAPDDLDERDVLWADLVLIDYGLKHWPSREETSSIALKPLDGLALAAIVRGYIERRTDRRPTAIALYTGKVSELRTPIGVGSIHLLARLNGLEWLFEKGTVAAGSSIAQHVSTLARATHDLSWGHAADHIEELMSMLCPRPQKISPAMRLDVMSCVPPVTYLSHWNHGLIVLRWLLHRCLPYPTFVQSTHYVAARLRVTVASLEAALRSGRTRLARDLQGTRYTGALGSLFGPRWWRTRVEDVVRNWTDGRSGDLAILRTAVRRLGGPKLQTLDKIQHPVVCLDEDFRPLPDLASIDEVLRSQPDDWPAYASHAWVTKAAAADERRLRATIVREPGYGD